MIHRQRVKLWVSRQIQLRFVVYVLCAFAAAALLISSATFYTIWSAVLDRTARGGNLADIYMETMRRLLPANIGLIFLLTVLACLGMLIMSHKVAGPAYRIMAILKDLRAGKTPDFKLRQGDLMGPVVDELKGFAEQHGALRRTAAEVVERWKNTEI